MFFLKITKFVRIPLFEKFVQQKKSEMKKVFFTRLEPIPGNERIYLCLS